MNETDYAPIGIGGKFGEGRAIVVDECAGPASKIEV